MKHTYLIATDGLCKNNQAAGGQKGTWAFVVYRTNANQIIGAKQGSDPETTNNRMEMVAVLEALLWLGRTTNSSAQILSDSALLVQGINEWMDGWSKRGWLKSGGEPVKNSDLWKKIQAAYVAVRGRVEVVKVKGHGSGSTLESRLNNAADSACNEEYLNTFM
jgi:ribonuclease HI